MRRTSIFVFFIITALFVNHVQYVFPQDETTPQTVTLKGFVFNIKTKKPLANAEIKIQPCEDYIEPSTIKTTFSNSDGYYEITCNRGKKNLYTILVSAENFISDRKRFEIPGYNKKQDFLLYPYLHEFGCLLETIHRGSELYRRRGHIFIRHGGRVYQDPTYFRDLFASDDLIIDFLKSIGLQHDELKSDKEIWSTIEVVWGILSRIWNSKYSQESYDYIRLDNKDEFIGLTSLKRMALTFKKYGYLPRLNCLYSAHDFATLLYRAGVPKERMAISTVDYFFPIAEVMHYSVIIYIKNNWISIDPTIIGFDDFPVFKDLRSIPENRYGFDYMHPEYIYKIPTSKLATVPLVISDYSKLTEADSSQVAEAYRERARLWSNSKEFEKANADFNAAIKLNPKDPLIYFTRATEWIKVGEFDRAMADFTEATKLNPNYIPAYFYRGNVWASKGDYDKAIADFSKIIEINPNVAQVFLARGKVWHFKKEFDKAINDYKKALKLEPNGKSAIDPLLKQAEAGKELR